MPRSWGSSPAGITERILKMYALREQALVKSSTLLVIGCHLGLTFKSFGIKVSRAFSYKMTIVINDPPPPLPSWQTRRGRRSTQSGVCCGAWRRAPWWTAASWRSASRTSGCQCPPPARPCRQTWRPHTGSDIRQLQVTFIRYQTNENGLKQKGTTLNSHFRFVLQSILKRSLLSTLMNMTQVIQWNYTWEFSLSLSGTLSNLNFFG